MRAAGVTETVVLETPVLIGYARISKADGSQSLDLQRDALREAGHCSLGKLSQDRNRELRPAGYGLIQKQP